MAAELPGTKTLDMHNGFSLDIKSGILGPNCKIWLHSILFFWWTRQSVTIASIKVGYIIYKNSDIEIDNETLHYNQEQVIWHNE